MFDEKVFTIDEIAQFLRVPDDAIHQEITSGRLRARSIAGHTRILQADLAMYLEVDESKAVSPPADALASGISVEYSSTLVPTVDFKQRWPSKLGEERSEEQFTEVREGVVHHLKKDYRVKVGFTLRESAGKLRRRSLVLVDRYPTVEFVAADEKKGGKMASIIKDRHSKQIPVGGTLPPEYRGLPVAPYSDVVVGPGASNGTAVICNPEDFETMVRHALIRCRFREERA